MTECGHSGRDRRVGFDGEIECIRCCVEEEVYGRQREQRRYEIARDVMAARSAAYALAFRFERGGMYAETAGEAVAAADALLKALEGE